MQDRIRAAVAAALACAPAQAQTEFAKLVPADPGGEQRLGHSVALEGTRLAAGAPIDDQGGEWSGAVYLFEHGAAGWSQSAKILAPDASAQSEFGWSVDLEWPRLFVSAWKHDLAGSDAGAVYVLEHDEALGWTLDALLLASDAAPCGLFGETFVAEGDLLAVRAEQPCLATFDERPVYVFRNVGGTWVEEARLSAPDAGYRRLFGSALLLAGGHLFVGSGLEEFDAGILYEFERIDGAWQQVDAILPGGTDVGFRPESLALESDTLVVGTPFDWHHPPSLVGRGAAHVFAPFGGSWRHQAKLCRATPRGSSVSAPPSPCGSRRASLACSSPATRARVAAGTTRRTRSRSSSLPHGSSRSPG